MFEDSTFESAGRIQTRSRGWMIAVFAFNTTILLALILIPLIYPEALPQIAMAFLMETPAPAAEEPKPVMKQQNAPARETEIKAGRIQAPSQIPAHAWIPGTQEQPLPGDVVSLDQGMSGTGSPDNPFSGREVHPEVRPAVRPPAHISSGVMEGMLIHKVIPEYPAIPRSIRLEGTVVLQATISRSGSIENLRVVAGPALLQRAALDAVEQWRYRPYLLNGEPVEVETTINVDFRLQ